MVRGDRAEVTAWGGRWNRERGDGGGGGGGREGERERERGTDRRVGKWQKRRGRKD